MRIVPRQCFTVAADFGNSRNRREQWRERIRAANQAARAGFREKSRIARELQCVPEALLGIDEQRLARGRRAVPAWARKTVTIASELRQRKPGIVFAPALGKLAVEQERQREIPARMREVGPERKRLPVCINSGEDIVSRLQGKAEIVPGDGMVGLERERRA